MAVVASSVKTFPQSKGLFKPSASICGSKDSVDLYLSQIHQAPVAAALLASKTQMCPRPIPSVIASDAADAATDAFCE